MNTTIAIPPSEDGIHVRAGTTDGAGCCVLCGAPFDRSLPAIVARSHAPSCEVTFLACSHCRTLTSPDAADAAARLYKDRDSANYAPGKSPLLESVKRTLLQSAYKGLISRHRVVRAVDYGCGNGTLANSIKALGIDVVAVDLQETRPAALAFEIAYRSVADFRLPRIEGCTALILRHVFEHMSEPVRALDSFGEVLAPGDLLVLEFPARDSALLSLLGSNWPGFYPPFHVSVLDDHEVIRACEMREFTLLERTRREPPLIAALIAQRTGRLDNLIRLIGLSAYPLQWLTSKLSSRSEAIELVFVKR